MENKNEIISIEILNEILKETIKLHNEMKRIRTKLDYKLFKIANKYEVIDNNLLVCKNQYRNSVKCYKQKTDKSIPCRLDFN